MIWSDSLYWLNKRAIFHNEFCNFKQYKNKDSGKCKPCPENSYSIDGPFSSSCIEKKEIQALGSIEKEKFYKIEYLSKPIIVQSEPSEPETDPQKKTDKLSGKNTIIIVSFVSVILVSLSFVVLLWAIKVRRRRGVENRNEAGAMPVVA